jgi:hypothetical protein
MTTSTWTVLLKCLDCPDTATLEIESPNGEVAELLAVREWGHTLHGTFNGRAVEYMRGRNRASRDRTLYAVVDGPDDNYAVVDLKTAIDLGGRYEWSV